jgi:Ca-activated chloride channel family protein
MNEGNKLHSPDMLDQATAALREAGAAGGPPPHLAAATLEILQKKAGDLRPSAQPHMKESLMSLETCRRLLRVLTLAASVLLTIALAYEGGRVTGSRRLAQAANNLRDIGLATHEHHDAFHSLPSGGGDGWGSTLINGVPPIAGSGDSNSPVLRHRGLPIVGLSDGTSNEMLTDERRQPAQYAQNSANGDNNEGYIGGWDWDTERQVNGKFRLTEEDRKIAARLKALQTDPKRSGGDAKGDTDDMLRLAAREVTGKVPEGEELDKLKERIESIEGRGPGEGGDRFREIVENRFLTVLNNPLSTFSIDVDTASYTKVRRFLMQMRQLPPPDAVRIEEFINYFHYSYPGPKAEPGEKASGKPFAVHTDVAACPWNAKHKLLRVGIKGRVIENKDRPASNLVFLVDVSGSMDSPDKLPLVKRGLKTLVERLRENDRVAIVVYAGNAGLVLDSTPGSEQKKIMDVLDSLQPQGSTNGAQGIHLAYELAQKHHIKDGTNRVILATDGDFNVGTTSDAELVRLVEQKAKSGVFLTALGFGVGNHNDSMLEQIADKGNGNYSYIDTELETRKVFVEQLGGTLVTIAKDVKIQVEFNPGKVAAYRLIGYENRMLRTEDFKDDTKDAGEIGAGHTVTALYELVPAGEPVPADTTSLKYQKPSELTAAAKTPELATVFLRYKDPESNTSKPLEFALKETDTSVGAAAADFKFAAAVASFGMLLRHSQYRGDATFDSVLKLAQAGADDEYGYRKEFIEMVKAAKEISGKK